MIVIPPIVITTAILTATNVAQSTNAEWLVGTGYSVGNEVRFTADDVNKNYENLIAGTGKSPPDFSNTTIPVPATIDWLDLGATNRFAMFDEVNGTQTVNADTVDVTLTPGQVVNSVVALNMDAVSIQVIMTAPGPGVVYDETIDLQSGPVENWYGFYFDPLIRDTAAVFLDLPAYPDADIQVIVDNTGSDAKIGTLIMGAQVSLGVALHGTSSGILDYSRVVTDDFGNTSIQERPFSKRADYAVRLPTSNSGFVQATLAGLRATAAVYIGDENLSVTFVYGFAKNFEIILSDAVWSDMSIEVRGLA